MEKPHVARGKRGRNHGIGQVPLWPVLAYNGIEILSYPLRGGVSQQLKAADLMTRWRLSAFLDREFSYGSSRQWLTGPVSKSKPLCAEWKPATSWRNAKNRKPLPVTANPL